MNNPRNALREEALSGNTAKFLIPLPGFHSYLPALFQPPLRAFSSSCALVNYPSFSQDHSWSGRWEVQSRKIDVVTGFSRHCEWEEARTHPLVYSPCLFSFCAPTKMTHAPVLQASPAASVTVWDAQIRACTPLFSKGGVSVYLGWGLS